MPRPHTKFLIVPRTPYLYRLRGEILLRRDPANPVPAEEAFQTAIAIAKQQSYELLASFSPSQNFTSPGAAPPTPNSVLEPALEGFATTTEMPEICRGAGANGAFGVGPLWADTKPS